MTIDMSKGDGPDRTPLAPLRGERKPVTLDTTVPVRPQWLRDAGTFYAVTRIAVHRALYRARRWAFYGPVALLLLVAYSPRGLARLAAVLGRYLYDYDSAQVRHAHAGAVETPEYARAQAIRKANLKARWMVAGSLIVTVSVPVLAWTAPTVLAGILAAAAFVWTVKLIPGRELWEYGVAVGVAVGVWWYTPGLAALIPAPPVWAILGAAVLAVLALGWLGRPVGKALAPGGKFATPAAVEKPTADMVVDALCRIGLPGMTLANVERVRQEVRIVAPGVATSAHGYTLELELPPGVTAEQVVGKRAQLAGALRRDLGCVWPGGNEDRHPGYLRLFLSHKPMNAAKQPPWPLMAGKAVDTFEALPLFTDEEMRWMLLTLAGTHTAVGGASGFGKSVWLRQATCTLALDPRAQLRCFDGKRSGDLDHVRKVAHAFHEGADPEDVDGVLAELDDLVAECTRRAKFLKALPADERSPKVTTALASKYPRDLAPIFAVFDEIQEYTEYGVTKAEKAVREKILAQLTRLARIGRSAGIFLVLTSQKPDASVIPSAIMGNCSIRIAFKVSDQVHNDQILGTSARKSGVDATMFGARDRGMAWIKGGDAATAQVVRSWSDMVDVALAVELVDKAFELRRAAGLLTGQAVGDQPEPDVEVDLLADIRDVMDHPPVPTALLAELRDALALLRPATWGHLDNDALGAMLRGAGVEPSTVWSRAAGKSGKGVKREWLDEGGATVHPLAGA